MVKNLLILATAVHLIGKALDKRYNAKGSSTVGPSSTALNPALPPEWAARIRGG